MPYRKKYKGKYNKYQKKAYADKKKRKAKAYRNRQQKVSIPTIKAICKEIVDDKPEVKWFVNNALTDVLYSLGHTSLWTGVNTTTRCSPVLLECFNNSSIKRGTKPSQRVSDQIYLQGVRIKFQIIQPINIKADQIGVAWYKVHWAIIKTNRSSAQTNEILNHMNTNKWILNATYNKDRKFSRLNIIKKGTITLRTTMSVELSGPGYVSRSTHKARFINRYIKIDRKHNMATINSSQQPFTYSVLLYSTQEKMRMSNDGFYAGLYDILSGTDTGITHDSNFSLMIDGLQSTIYYTDS